MNIPVTPLMWTAAFLPVLVLLILMVKCNWSAWAAAIAGLVITVITSRILYKASWKLLILESKKGVWNSLSIILIIGTSLLMYQVSEEAGAFLVIRSGMQTLFPNELLRIIAMGWAFESFLQGITGFGVPVVVGTPLLVGIGVSPGWAVVIALLGQSWGNTFGTLAAAWDALVMSCGLKTGSAGYLQTALWTAAFILIWNAVIGFTICWFYGRKTALKKGIPIILLMVIFQGGGELFMSQINTTLACFLPSLAALFAVLFMSRSNLYKEEWQIEASQIMEPARMGKALKEYHQVGQSTQAKKNSEILEQSVSDMSLLEALVPFVLLSIITLMGLLVKPLHSFLGPFAHPAMFLSVTSFVSLIYYRKHSWIKGSFAGIFRKSFRRMLPSGTAVIVLIIMAKLMSGTGQTMVMADGIARTFKTAYVILAPLIGLLGTFMTGSNMSSNILFGDFQLTTAQLLKLDSAMILAAQSAGGSIGSSLSPSNIALGTAAAGKPGSEGKIMKTMIPVTVPALLLIGGILLAYQIM